MSVMGGGISSIDASASIGSSHAWVVLGLIDMFCPSGGGVGGSTVSESGSCLSYRSAVTGLGCGDEATGPDALEDGGGGAGRFQVVVNSTGGGMATYRVL